MTREEAERLYVETIITHGNPRFFIWHFVEKLDNEELVDALSEFEMNVEIEED